MQDTINSFEHQVGLVEAIDDKKNSRSLAEAINDKKRIIICTIQKFLFAKKDMEKFRGRKFAIIIDEAHQGQNGESAKSLRRSLIDIGVAIKEYAEEAGIEEEEVDLTDEYINAVIGQGRHDNQSFFAFTATPRGQTLESFGTVVGMTPEGEPIKAPFHVYSMRQAIEEGYILDVLANYTTVKEAFRLIRVSEDNPELIEGQASRALFKYYKQHGYTIAQKTEMIMTNFLENCRYQIGGKGKAMVVADSRANAVRYYLAIKKYLADHAEQCVGCDVMIAFSGEVTLDDYPSEKPFTEATMNLDENGKYITTDKKFRKAFHSSQYNILVVANKYQTGFDEPLLHTMYVDKKLRDVTAVQTLSRLNRTTFGKNSTFVLDFENTEEDIKVHTLFMREIPQKMWPLPIGDLFTVGGATADKLRQAKIMTIGDLAHTDLARVQKIVGMKMGKHIHDYANGIDPSPVLAEPEEAKGYSISATLEEDVKKAAQAYPVLLALADSVTARIRSDGAKAYCVAVTIRDNSFKTRSHQRSLMNPTDISKEVYEISKELFDELWDGTTPLRLLGIAMTNITREETMQFSLFQDESRERSRKIDKTKDALNAKFGAATIVRGSSIQSKIDVGKKYQAQMESKKKG